MPLELSHRALDNNSGAPDSRSRSPRSSHSVRLYSSRVGGAIAFPLANDLSLEAEVGYRRQELNALSAHLSVGFGDLPRIGRIRPYLAAGIGLDTYNGTPLPQPDGTLATLRAGWPCR